MKATIDTLHARHSIEATFGARLPIEQRHALKARYPDAEHPVVRIHPETGEKVLFVSGYATHFTNFHTSANVRYGQDFAPGVGQSARLSDRPRGDPRISGALALEAEQRRHLGQSLHPALRRHGLLARRPEDGTRRNHRRPPLLIRTRSKTCNSSTIRCFPRPRRSWSSPSRPTARNGRPERFPGGHSADHGRACPEGGRLLQCRRDRAAHPRPRAGRDGLQAAVDVQRAASAAPRGGARHDPPGRRIDLLRSGRRGRRGQVAVRRRPPHARRARPEAGPGDDRRQHDPDEHHGPDDATRNIATPAWPARSSTTPIARWSCRPARNGSRSICGG